MIPSWARELLSVRKSRQKGDDITLNVCPFCGNVKWNLQVSVSKCVYHCWVCDAGGSVTKLLRELGITYDAGSIVVKLSQQKQQQGILAMPDNKKLLHNKSVIAKRAIDYLRSRDLSDQDIVDWDIRIGTGSDKSYCGFDYFGWTILPLYGLRGLEFWCGINHTFSKKYRLPPEHKDRFVPKSRGSKDIIIVEGIFDGTSAWKYSGMDVMVLFGKFLGQYQFDMLVKANYQRVYVCLDSDAEKQSVELATKLSGAGTAASIVHLPAGHDPNSIGQGIVDCINSAEIVRAVTRSRMRRLWLLNAK